MFWAIDSDSLTINGIKLMKRLYPNENASVFSKVNESNIYDKNKDDNKKLESPKRISCFAHGSVGDQSGEFYYGNMSADKFAKKIITKLKNAANKDATIKETLTNIDLFGCMSGCDNGKNPVYAQVVQEKVNKALKKEGFKLIQFKAITNRIKGEQDFLYSLFLEIPKTGEKNTFILTGAKTEKDHDEGFKAMETILSSVKSCEKINAAIDSEEKKLKEIKNDLKQLFKLYNITNTANNSKQDAYLLGIDKLLDHIMKEKNSDPLQIKQQIEKTLEVKNEYIKLNDTINKNKLNANNLKETIKEQEKIYKKTIITLLSDFADPREIVDKYPCCNFTSKEEKLAKHSLFQPSKDAEEVHQNKPKPFTPHG